jgi:hypothetical protein
MEVLITGITPAPDDSSPLDPNVLFFTLLLNTKFSNKRLKKFLVIFVFHGDSFLMLIVPLSLRMMWMWAVLSTLRRYMLLPYSG